MRRSWVRFPLWALQKYQVRGHFDSAAADPDRALIQDPSKIFGLRSPMRGSLRERRPGVWELIVQLPRDPTSARAGQLSRTVHGTKREAQRALAASSARSRPARSPRRPRHWASCSPAGSTTSASSFPRRPCASTDGWCDKLLDPDLGKLPLRRVTTQRIDAYYASLARERGLSPASIRHVHAVLRGSLGQAVRWGWISSNAAASASPPKLRRREITPPAMHAARTLLEAADKHDPDFGALFARAGGNRCAAG